MITITYEGKKVIIEGHADYSEKDDIVCASVSSIMYTTVNAMLRFDRDAIKFNDDGKKVIIELLKDTKENQILLANMIALYVELSEKYPNNIIMKLKARDIDVRFS